MNDKKIAFIICVNNELYFEECRYYINQLHIPQGYEAEVFGIREAVSMCAAYNLGMQSTDARYKVYMHQDVFIRNRDFLQDMLRLFAGDETVGMIGMVGGNRMPKTGVAYRAWDTGTVDCRDPDMAYFLAFEPEVRQDAQVEAVDGLLIATQYDVPWREDLFVNFDFYDVSQSFEMRRAGYRILVPYQKVPWVIHDSSFAKLDHYDENRRICMSEYADYFYADGGHEFIYNGEWNRLSDELAAQIKQLMQAGEWKEAAALLASYRTAKMKSSVLEMLGMMSDIHEKELEAGVCHRFFDGTDDWQQIYERYIKVRFLLRRMELHMPKESYCELTDAVKDGSVSWNALLVMILHGTVDKCTCLKKLAEYYSRTGQKDSERQVRELYAAVKKMPVPVAHTRTHR